MEEGIEAFKNSPYGLLGRQLIDAPTGAPFQEEFPMVLLEQLHPCGLDIFVRPKSTNGFHLNNARILHC
jgi:hypothetical protein